MGRQDPSPELAPLFAEFIFRCFLGFVCFPLTRQKTYIYIYIFWLGSLFSSRQDQGGSVLRAPAWSGAPWPRENRGLSRGALARRVARGGRGDFFWGIREDLKGTNRRTVAAFFLFFFGGFWF